MICDKDFLELLSQCDSAFRNLKSFSEDIKLDIILCESEEELYKKRCDLTSFLPAKELLLRNKNQYIKAAGCFVIPPIANQFTVLLKRTENNFYDCYNYIHELVHISNYLDYLTVTNFRDHIEPYKNNDFFLWDEYNARYVSTCVIIGMFQQIVDIEDLSHCIRIICDVLRKDVNEKNINSYDGSQLLGAIEAAFEKSIVKNYSDYLSPSEIEVLKYYKNLTDISCFVNTDAEGEEK